MEIKYQLFEKENLFVQKFSGSFSIEQYVSYTRNIVAYLLSKTIEKVLIDFRDLRIGDVSDQLPDDYYTTFDKMTEFRKDINKNELKNREVKLVFWVDNPLPTLTAHLFSDNFPSKNYDYCLTTDDIIRILQLSKDLDLVYLTNNLENTFQNT